MRRVLIIGQDRALDLSLQEAVTSQEFEIEHAAGGVARCIWRICVLVKRPPAR